ncbi:hypothetical protein GQ44DRAFT_716487 [Phaeosphaeriaceae sp. PMI808]|nr:hypothetical protein GQ44DRAFT_716487 [Phaeosphaeriaceae sp. PMI808]
MSMAGTENQQVSSNSESIKDSVESKPHEHVEEKAQIPELNTTCHIPDTTDFNPRKEEIQGVEANTTLKADTIFTPSGGEFHFTACHSLSFESQSHQGPPPTKAAPVETQWPFTDREIFNKDLNIEAIHKPKSDLSAGPEPLSKTAFVFGTGQSIGPEPFSFGGSLYTQKAPPVKKPLLESKTQAPSVSHELSPKREPEPATSFAKPAPTFTWTPLPEFNPSFTDGEYHNKSFDFTVQARFKFSQKSVTDHQKLDERPLAVPNVDLFSKKQTSNSDPALTTLFNTSAFPKTQFTFEAKPLFGIRSASKEPAKCKNRPEVIFVSEDWLTDGEQLLPQQIPLPPSPRLVSLRPEDVPLPPSPSLRELLPEGILLPPSPIIPALLPEDIPLPLSPTVGELLPEDVPLPLSPVLGAAYGGSGVLTPQGVDISDFFRGLALRNQGDDCDVSNSSGMAAPYESMVEVDLQSKISKRPEGAHGNQS